jgi:hypothetical protein
MASTRHPHSHGLQLLREVLAETKEAAGKYPKGLNPPRWCPKELRPIWRAAVERFFEEQGAPDYDQWDLALSGLDANKVYRTIVILYKNMIRAHSAEPVPVSIRDTGEFGTFVDPVAPPAKPNGPTVKPLPDVDEGLADGPGDDFEKVSVYPALDFQSYRPGRWQEGMTIEDDIIPALRQLLEGVASDLGVDDMRDDAFIDYARDRLADAKVPHEIIDQAIARIQKTGAKAACPRCGSSDLVKGIKWNCFECGWQGDATELRKGTP